jgi:NitT/TauT family transport system ATP-binding protein
MISVEGLWHSYPSDESAPRLAVQDVTLRAEPSELIAVVGPSGCGKTTMLNVLAGLEPVQRGTVQVGGQPPAAGRHDVGYMLARDCLLPWSNATDNAALGLEMRGMPRADRRRLANETLAQVGLSGFEASYPAQLSQGMRQRVALARLFAAEPAFALLDEPFSALDAQSRVLVQDAFLEIWERRRSTVVLITHDLGEAITLADRVFVMSARPGRVIAVHPIDLPRPRSAAALRGDPRFHAIFERIWADLQGEVYRAALEPALEPLRQAGAGP